MYLIRTLHKYISLTVCGLWFLQALTGTILVFHREWDDALLGAPAAAVDLKRIDQRIVIEERRHPNGGVTVLTASGGLPGFYDLYLREPNGTHLLRLDGKGDVLRDRPFDFDYGSMTAFQLMYLFHTSLFVGETGRIFLGLSGVLLLTTVAFGLQLAWPPRGRWRNWLLPSRQKQPAMIWFTWHRAVGLWFVAPAIIFISAGAILGLIEPIDELLGVSTQAPNVAPKPSAAFHIPASQAIETAIAQYPGSTFAVLEMPTEKSPWYRVRVKAPGEPRRVFGTTAVYVDATNGKVLASYDARTAPFATQFAMDTFPVHTGEIFGLPGRVLSVVNGLWLMSMIALGFGLWWVRNRQKAQARLRARQA